MMALEYSAILPIAIRKQILKKFHFKVKNYWFSFRKQLYKTEILLGFENWTARPFFSMPSSRINKAGVAVQTKLAEC